MKRTMHEKARCFVLLAKFTSSQYDEQEKCSKLLLYKKKLEGLYQRNSIAKKNQIITEDVLFRILQIQEVGSVEHYQLNGSLIKIHVLEDTDI